MNKEQVTENCQAVIDSLRGKGELQTLAAGMWCKPVITDPMQPNLRYRCYKKPNGSDKVREMLKGGKLVLCGVSNILQDTADKRAMKKSWLSCIETFDGNVFWDTEGDSWEYASQIDTSKFANYAEAGDEND